MTVDGPHQAAKTTPVPNQLLDDVMPNLSDTELRVLLAVARATLGWRAESGRKRRDWLTHGQLKARTGRASAAVSAAVDRLVRQGYLQVEAEDGQPLVTPSERRRHRARMYYRLGGLISESEFRFPKMTKENGTKILKSDPLLISEIENGSSVDEPAAGEEPDLPAGALPAVSFDAAETELSAEGLKLVNGFVNLYSEQFGHSPIIAAADLAALDAVKNLESERVTEFLSLLPAFFTCDFKYVRRRGFSLASFLETAQILRQKTRVSGL